MLADMPPSVRRLAVAVLFALGLSTLVAAVPAGASASAPRPDRISGATRTVNQFELDVNRRGEGWAIWIALERNKYALMVAHRTPRGVWSKAERLGKRFQWFTERATWAGRPDIAVDERGVAVAVWAENRGRGAVQVRSSTYRPKKGWSRPTWLSGAGPAASFPDVSVSRRGHAVVQWAGGVTPGFETPTTLWTSYRDVKGGWEAPVRLDVDPSFVLDARTGEPAIDDRGVATLVWDEKNPSSFGVGRIRVATRGTSGGWTTETLFQRVDRADQPQVATTPDGQLLATWKDGENAYAKRRTPDGVWGPQETVLASVAGYTVNTHGGIGIADNGLAAVWLEDVQLQGNLVQPAVAVQSAPGAPWVREDVAPPGPAYFISGFFADFDVSPRGDVAMTFARQDSDPDAWYDAYLASRSPSGAWSGPVRVGRYAADAVLGYDRRGRLGVVYGEGTKYDGREGCCDRVMALWRRAR